MNANCFIDSNIFVYAKIEVDIRSLKAKKLLESFKEGEALISTQVIGEFYNVLNKYKIPDLIIQQNIINIVNATSVGIITFETIKSAWKIKEKYKYSYYDSLIIASALENHCTVLYSEDLQNGQLINEKLKIINPFE